MIAKIQFLIYFFVTIARLIRPGGVKTVVAENLLLKQQLMTLTRQRSRTPRLTTFDRFLFGYLAFFISKARLQKNSDFIESRHNLDSFIRHWLKENINAYILAKH